jgi:hypothetical protein
VLLALGAAAWLGLGLAPGCGVVDLGDNIIPPSNSLDEDFFYCQVQPNVVTAQSCANGIAGDMGCHATTSALFLEDAAGVAPPACDPMTNELLPGEVAPDVYQRNLTRVRSFVGSDPMSSPFYRRPLGLDSHPRVIYAMTSMEEMLVRDWILGGGT